MSLSAWRRWYILLPGLLLTGVVAALVGNGVAPEYESTGAAVLVQAPEQTDATTANPYAEDSGPAALQIIVTSSETRSRLADSGLESEYELTVDERAPIFRFDVTSATAEGAVATGSAVFEELSTTLLREQRASGVPDSAMATIQVLDAPDSVVELVESKFRTVAVIGLIGIVLSLALAIFFDNFTGLRRRREERNSDIEAGQIDDGSIAEADGPATDPDAEVPKADSPATEGSAATPVRPRPRPRPPREAPVTRSAKHKALSPE